MKHIRSKINSWNLENKKVLLRVDYNIETQKTVTGYDFRLQQALPTIDLLLKKGARIILATHIDRPQRQEPELSTKQFLPWFADKGYSIDFSPDLVSNLDSKKQLILLENLRFFPGEQAEDSRFAEQLAKMADFYVSDAFATMHRTDTSIVTVPLLFAPEKRSIGLLVEKELAFLNPIKTAQGLVLIVGGAKIADKLPFINHFIGKAKSIILCPALSVTFSKALGERVGASLVDSALISACADSITRAKQSRTTLLLPIDYQVKNNRSNTLSFIDAKEVSEQDFIVSFGPKTGTKIQELCNDAHVIFYNGLSGFIDSPQTLWGANEVFKSMSQSKATTIIGGGDSVTAAIYLGYEDKIQFLSTGGGATLAYLSGEILPGLQLFADN